MIYSCENCKNRNNCPENKEGYERTCKLLDEVATAIDNSPKYHSYYSLTIKCDYWFPDVSTYPCVTHDKKGGAMLRKGRWKGEKNNNLL